MCRKDKVCFGICKTKSDLSHLNLEPFSCINDLISCLLELSLIHILEQFLSILPPSFGKQFDQWSGSIGELFKKAASSAGDYGVAHAGGVAKGVTSGLLGLVVMLFAAYMFSLEREKLIAWYEKCIPGFVKHKINVFMKNSVGVLVSY